MKRCSCIANSIVAFPIYLSFQSLVGLLVLLVLFQAEAKEGMFILFFVCEKKTNPKVYNMNEGIMELHCL